MPPARFEPSIATSERSQTHALESVATGIGFLVIIHGNYAAVADAPQAEDAGQNMITRT